MVQTMGSVCDWVKLDWQNLDATEANPECGITIRWVSVLLFEDQNIDLSADLRSISTTPLGIGTNWRFQFPLKSQKNHGRLFYENYYY